MAKQEKLELDDFDFDDELNFDFGFDDLSGSVDPSINKDDRKPVVKAFKNTISGAVDAFKDTSLLSKLLRESLPDQYGEVIDKVDTGSSTIASLYDEAIREIKPNLSQLANKTDKLVPENQKTLKKISGYFKNKFGSSDDNYRMKSSEEYFEESLEKNLRDIFQEQSENDLKDKAENTVRFAIQDKQSRSNLSILGSIDTSLSRITQYQDKVTQSYQKKSLELQYRSYFTQSSLLKSTEKFFQIFKAQNDSVIKNTSLPEYAKINLDERFKEKAKSKFVDKVKDKVFGAGSIADTIGKNLKDKFKDQIKDFKAGLESAVMTVDDMVDAKESLADVGEDTGSIVQRTMGSIIGESIGEMGAKFIKSKIPEDGKVAEIGHSAVDLMNDPFSRIDKLRNSDFIKENIYQGGVKGTAADIGKLILDSIMESRPDMSLDSGQKLGDLEQPTSIFNTKTQKTITDIIPGYLSRIHREVVALRTGNDKTALTVYDFKSGKFKSQTTMSDDVRRSLKEKLKSSVYRSAVDTAYQDITKGLDIPEDQANKIKDFISGIATSRTRQTPEQIKSSKIYKSSSVKESLDKIIERLDTTETSKYKASFSRNIGKIKDSIPDIRKDIDELYRAGYKDVLEELGIIKTTIDGRTDIDTDKYISLLNESNIQPSDINIKENIKAFNPQEALDAIRKTKVSSWSYKGDNGKPYVGPMAQDVKANMGNTAAPNGKAIDLVTLNGINMSAIQALEERMHSQTTESWVPVLESIKADTSTIVSILENPKSFSFGGFDLSQFKGKGIEVTIKDKKDFFSNLLNSLVDFVGSSTSKLFGLAGDGVTTAKDKIYKPLSELIKSSYDNNKDTIANTFRTLLEKSVTMASSALEMSTDILTNKFPKGFVNLKDFGIKVKDKIFDTIREYQDIYIKGMDVPALKANLIKSGFYIDKVTGKVIKTIDDIKGPVVDKLGNMVITIEDLSKGLVDSTGSTIKSFTTKMIEGLVNIGRGGLDNIKTAFNAVKGISLPSFKRPFSSGKDSSKIYDVLVEIRDILKGDHISPSGFMGPLPETSIEVQQPDGEEPIQTIDPSPRYVSSGFNPLSMVGTLLGKGKSAFAGIKGKQGFIGKAAGFLGGLFGSSETEQPSTNETSPETTSKIEKESIKDKVINIVKKIPTSKAAWNDKDGSGRRDGAWQDRLEELKKRQDARKNEVEGASLDPRYTEGDGLGSIMELGKKLLGFLGTGAGFLFGKIKTLFTKTASILGGISSKAIEAVSGISSLGSKVLTSIKTIGAKAIGIVKNLGGLSAKILGGVKGTVGKVLSTIKGMSVKGIATKAATTAGTILGRAKGLGTKALTMIKGMGVKGIATKAATIGSKALSVGGTVIKAGAALAGKGALTAAATAGSSLLAGAGTALTAVGGIIASPVVIGTAAVAATAYGVYKLYKYFTKDDVNEYEAIRIKQYGLTNSDVDKHHNHTLLALENYLLDGRIVINDGVPDFNNTKIDTKDILDIFSIDVEDIDYVDRLAYWLSRRFKPFFLTHLAAMKAATGGTNLKNIENHNQTERSRYLSLIEFESGPYRFEVSPFKDIKQLNVDKSLAINAIKKLLHDIKEGNDKTAKHVVRANEVNNKAKSKFDNTIEKNEVNRQKNDNLHRAEQNIRIKNSYLTNEPDVKQYPVKTREILGHHGEDGISKENIPSELKKTSTSAINRLTVADGPIRDGESGMQFIKITDNADLSNVNPLLLKHFKAMVQEYGETTGKSVIVTEAFRSRKRQEELYRKYPGRAAPPGRSLHEFGLAIDANRVELNEMDKMGLMRKYGFTRPVGQEPWHIEPAGIQGNPNKAKKDKVFADKAIAASLFIGGGGYGTVSNAAKYRRNTELALSLWDAGATTVSQTDKEKVFDRISQTDKSQSDTQTETQDQTSASNVIPFPGTQRQSADGGIGTSPVGGSSNDPIYSSSISQSGKFDKAAYMPEMEEKPAFRMSDLSDSKQPTNREEVKQVITEVSKKMGLDPAMMQVFAARESSLNPNARARTSSAAGLYQFIKSTWNEQVKKHGRKYGIDFNTSPTDARASTILAGEYIKSNINSIKSVKPNPSMSDIYLTHFLGAGGARQMLRASPDAIAARVLPKAARSNAPLFYKGGKPLTVREFLSGITSKLNHTASSFNINLNQTPETDVASTDVESAETGQETSTTDQGDTTALSTSTGMDVTPGQVASSGMDVTPDQTTILGEDNKSILTSTQPSIKKDKPSWLDKKTIDTGMQMPVPFSKPTLSTVDEDIVKVSKSKPIDQGPSFSMVEVTSSLDKVGSTLDKSLSVQEQMLATLRELTSNLSPEVFQSMQKDLIQVVKTNQKRDTVSQPAVDLKRRVS